MFSRGHRGQHRACGCGCANRRQRVRMDVKLKLTDEDGRAIVRELRRLKQNGIQP